ncbi:hypothetical protein HHI36_012357 [Cryptolaemus montrouzieri]|uniref:Major facilitator superfamily (MFS) profile domain-containing protein n=1 Tax=Cryptolaemus montrouzieri TaxID=559131 RepID=A0ABD2NEU4_9CUCU
MEATIQKTGSFKRTRMYISVFMGLFLAIAEGALSGWPSPAIYALSKANNTLGRALSENEEDLLASITTPGSVVGALLAVALSQKFGRKPILSIQGIPPLIFFLTMAFGKSLLLFDISRFISGMSIGGMYTILPLYICEIVEPEHRGKCCAGFGISMNIGILLCYVLGYNLSFFWFHLVLSLIPITFLILFPLLALESPYYILRTNPVEAEKFLREVRASENVSEELKRMKECVEETEQNTSINIFETKAMRKAIVLSLGMMTFIVFSGILVFQNYSGEIFEDADFSWSTQTELIIVAVMQLVISGFAIPLVERFKRKPLLCTSFAGCGISLIPLGTYFFMKDNGLNVTGYGWVPLVSLVGYVVSVNIAVGPLGKSVLGEFIPLKIKSITTAISTIYCSLGLFFTSLYFNDATKAIGRGVCFWIFAAAAICGSIFIRTCMVETKGKTLEEIQDEMNGIKKNNFRCK